jgi:hypothetical protein
MDPSGPVPPKPEVSGLRAPGENRKPVAVASLGRNFSKLVTAGTVGTGSVATGRCVGWNLDRRGGVAERWCATAVLQLCCRWATQEATPGIRH